MQLATRTKMFCGCELSFGEPPNTRTCPVCLGLPGSLPVANARAVHFGLMIGLALGSELAPRSIFHRKNYFYPDLPKGYQISQYDEPLCLGGQLGEVRIHRVHLEEDAAKLTHVGESGRIHGSDASVVDFNRGGTPLAEIVTEPDLRTAEQAERVAAAAAHDAAPARRERREHGGGLAALRREHLAAPDRHEHARREDRAEEHELLPLHRTRHPGGDRAPAQGSSKAGERSTQETLHFDPALGRDHLAALQGGGARLPLLPRARPRCRCTIDEQMLAAAREAMSELPADARGALRARAGAESPTAPSSLAFRSELGDYFEATLLGAEADARPRRRKRSGRTGSSGELAGRGCGERRGPGEGSQVEPAALAVLVGLVAAQADQRRRWAPGARQAGGRGRRSGWRSSRPRGLRRSAARMSWARSSPPRWPPTPTRPSACAAATRRRSARSSVR